MTTVRFPRCTRNFLRSTVVLGLICRLTTHAAEPPANPPGILPAKTTGPVVELSPFEVRAESDVGYQAANTTSGSRLNTRLKDTPAAISPFTPEFLSDLGATNLADLIGYATNVELDTEDATNGFNNPEGKLAISNDAQFRMRGMAAGSSRDFVDSSIPVDLFNIERAEVASGPNSILFGLGQAGGNVSLTGKRANLTRGKTTFSNVLGSWKLARFTADHNQVIIPRKFAVRLVGLYENSEGWRKWNFTDQKRLGGAIALRPFQATTVHATFETGRHQNSVLVNWNAVDSLTRWLASGRPIADGAAVTGTTRFNQTNARYAFNEQDGIVYNTRGELQSSSTFATQTLATPALSPYEFNTTGPGGKRQQAFNSRAVLVEQRIGDRVTLELGYFHNQNDATAYGSSGQPTLFGDPNLTVPPASFVGSVPNPRAGQLYLEDSWNRDRIAITNDVYRLTAAWEKDLGRWFGRHRVAGLVENSRSDRVRHWGTEIFVDQSNVAISAATNPEGATNSVLRRHYVTVGDFSTYYVGNSSIPVPAFTIAGKEYHAAYTSRTKTNALTRKDLNSFMLAAQSFWFGDRLITTAGYRLDQIEFQNANESRVANPNDPRVLAKKLVLNEWDFDGTDRVNHYRPTTFSAGAVVHATKRLSVFYNYATNKGTPRFDRTILPDGDVPPPTGGRSKDFGVMCDVFGDDRIFIRVTRFDTAQIKDAPIIPGGVGVNTANALGGDNLITIYDALLTAGRLTQQQYDTQLVTYNAGTVDVLTKGYELELVANPTKNLTFRFGYSHSERQRANIFSEIYAYYDAQSPRLRALAGNNPTLLATINTELATVYEELATQVALQSGPLGSRPDKFNFTARFKATEGRLRGAFAGGGFRYQGKNVMAYDIKTGAETLGNDTLFADAFAGYKVRVPLLRSTLTLQLNVRNLSNSYRVVVGRRNTAGDGLRRIYLNEPRSYRFTTTLEF
ncbi:MAG: hypothetical protein EXS32_09745 [Opitutus sp.]|nr:hypothetical protein [Opitutus sp.]